MGFHLYANDTQIYISFKSSEVDLPTTKVEAGIRDIDYWMSLSMLKLNRGKPELLVLSARLRPSPSVVSVFICGELIQPSATARNVGVICDSFMSMEPQVNAICKSMFFHLENLSRIRKYISSQSAEILIQAFVTSRLDFCNSLLYGIPKALIRKIQSVQNSAARLLSLTCKHDHITPILKELHWLPIEHRIRFKVLLLTYKCLNNIAPSYLIDLVHPYVPIRNLRSTSKHFLEVTPNNYYYCSCCYYYYYYYYYYYNIHFTQLRTVEGVSACYGLPASRHVRPQQTLHN